mmetsp:Transcript_40341/g.59288  ORF Transcript_40341/g.59288 Transcript_40341/m.59288 type:complete len:82 (+) Transcript_40341:796-1041(+)
MDPLKPSITVARNCTIKNCPGEIEKPNTSSESGILERSGGEDEEVLPLHTTASSSPDAMRPSDSTVRLAGAIVLRCWKGYI